MKNESRFAEARKFAVQAISSIADTLFAMANRRPSEYRYRSNKVATRKPANNIAGCKLAKLAMYGTVGAGMHGVNRKAPVAGVTYSPKRDIGKGPAFTLSRCGKSHEFEKRSQQRGQQFTEHYIRRLESLPA